MTARNIVLISLVLIVIVLCISILYGSCVVYEKFETASLFEEAPDPDTTKPIVNIVKQKETVLSNPIIVKDDSELVNDTSVFKSDNVPAIDKISIAKPAQISPPVQEEPVFSAMRSNSDSLNTREKELFDQIIKDNMSGEDLEKLIRAGAVTEKMVEKFLNELDKENSGDNIEAFCSSSNTYSSI